MAQLTFYCPYTNEPIPSGIEIDPRSAEKVREVPIDLYCPHCKCLHHGVIADGTTAPRPKRQA
jgi:hypothetical protein